MTLASDWLIYPREEGTQLSVNGLSASQSVTTLVSLEGINGSVRILCIAAIAHDTPESLLWPSSVNRPKGRFPKTVVVPTVFIRSVYFRFWPVVAD